MPRMQWIVDELFVGNRLATAEIVTREGERVDLRNIRSPIVCSCQGRQHHPAATGARLDPRSLRRRFDIRVCGQTIVYRARHHHHHLRLGRHRQEGAPGIRLNIDLIDVLPPGLYEAVMTGRPPSRSIRKRSTATGSCASNRAAWKTSGPSSGPTPPTSAASRQRGGFRNQPEPLSPAWSSPSSRRSRPTERRVAEEVQEHRTALRIFSDRNPLMKRVAQLAEQVREHRQPATPDNPFLQWQATLSDSIIALDGYRDQRDAGMEKLFLTIYTAPVCRRCWERGRPTSRARARMARSASPTSTRIAELSGHHPGRAREAAIRALLWTMAGEAPMSAHSTPCARCRPRTSMTLQAFKQTVREQYFSLVLDPEGRSPPSGAHTARRRDQAQASWQPSGAPPMPRAWRRAIRRTGWRSLKLFASGARAVTAKKAPRKPLGAPRPEAPMRRAAAGDCRRVDRRKTMQTIVPPSLEGTKALVVGVAGDSSILWLRQAFRELGADLASVPGRQGAAPCQPLARGPNAALFLPLDVSVDGRGSGVRRGRQALGQLHPRALDRLRTQGRPAGRAPRLFGLRLRQGDGRLCHSFVRMAKLAAPLMKNGGTMMAMSYHGGGKVVPTYSVMGPVKAALKSAVTWPMNWAARASACAISPGR